MSAKRNGSIMSDAHKVNIVKQKLLTWLILYGKSEVNVAQLLEHDIVGINMWELIDERLVRENTKTAIQTFRLTGKAVKFLQQGELNEQ
jgi:hypothetical protein